MAPLPSLIILRALLRRLITRASKVDVYSRSGRLRMTAISAELARAARALRRAAEEEFRHKYKLRMLADYGWRWRVICELGGYDVLDRWRRGIALRAEGTVSPARAQRIAPCPPRPTPPRSKLARTDKSGWFRLPPLARGGEAGQIKATAASATPQPCNAAAPARRKPICVTAQELDLRTPGNAGRYSLPATSRNWPQISSAPMPDSLRPSEAESFKPP